MPAQQGFQGANYYVCVQVYTHQRGTCLMGHNWVHAATENQTARLGDRLVLFVLAECADVKTGTCYPSVQTIAERTVMSERQVQRCLVNLVKLGIITVQKNASQYGTNIFTLLPNMSPGDNMTGVTNRAENVSDLSPEPSVKPSEKKKVERKPAKEGELTPLPDDWEPSPAAKEQAIEAGMTEETLRAEIFGFRAYYVGQQQRNWNQRWGTWAANWIRYGKKQATVQKVQKLRTGRKMTDAEKVGFIG